jgi:hypothetical protein
VIPRTKHIASRMLDLPEPFNPVIALKEGSHPVICVRTGYDLKPTKDVQNCQTLQRDENYLPTRVLQSASWLLKRLRALVGHVTDQKIITYYIIISKFVLNQSQTQSGLFRPRRPSLFFFFFPSLTFSLVCLVQSFATTSMSPNTDISFSDFGSELTELS